MSEEQARYDVKPISLDKQQVLKLIDDEINKLPSGMMTDITKSQSYTAKSRLLKLKEKIQSGTFDSSSEQAWKEEIEWMQAINQTLSTTNSEVEALHRALLREYFEMEKKLNQAVEVLKDLDAHMDFGEEIQDAESMGDFEDTSGINAVFERARDFLSSLSQEGEACKTCHGVGEVTQITGQRPESYEERNVLCPECQGTEGENGHINTAHVRPRTKTT